GDEVRVTVIATGFEGFETLARRPIQVRDRARRRGIGPLGDRERRELQVSADDVDVPDFLKRRCTSPAESSAARPVEPLRRNPPLRVRFRRVTMAPREVVESFWRAMAANDWDAAAAHLADGFVVDWPCSGERFTSREAYAEVQRRYPAA